jgi:hypothetical protein
MGALVAVALAAQATTVQPSPPPSSAPPAAASTAEPISRGTVTYVDLEAGAGYSTNPTLSITDAKGAAFGRLSARAVHTRITDRTTTVLTGFLQGQFYTRGQSSQKTVNLSASHDARVSEKLRVFGDASLGYDEGGQYDNRVFSAPNVPLPPGVIQPPIVIGPGGDFFSVSSKSYTASAHIGGQLAVSARDFVTASTGLNHVVTKIGAFPTRYTTIPVSLGWDRQLSTRTTVGARVAASYTDYNGPVNIRTISPQFTIQSLLSERLSLNAAVGVAFSRTDTGIATRRSTGPSGNVSLCWRGEKDNMCADASIDQQTATAAGPAKSVSVGVNYSRRLDADQTLAFSLSASRYSNPVLVTNVYSFSRATYLRAAADYSRRIGNRLFAGVSLAARKVGQTGPDPKADLSGSLFLRYRLGDIR